MKQIRFIIFIGSFAFLAACEKDDFAKGKRFEVCELQKSNPSGKSYASDSVIIISCNKKQCGIIPLNKNNFWVYEDSIFNNGQFSLIKKDTLRFNTTYKSLADGLIWWKSNISIGLPTLLLANDSSIFGLEKRNFMPELMDVKNDIRLFIGDTLKFITSFDDAAALGRTYKMNTTITTTAGSFMNCIYYEKNARDFRKDQIIFKPGLGVLKYVVEIATPGSSTIKMQQVSTLLAFHIE